MKEHDRRFRGKVKLLIALALGIFLTLFTIQNMAEVELTILFWTIQARRVAVIGISFLIGLAIGWIIKSQRQSDSH